ncbi:MAG: ABC transporter ATP-binding protein [Gammaproteobacteria bacterium RIFCSPHIGHO2_12_FULL_35_23]|nr:MAG: ABC transporter ATP-binding protein [Gammaproteobacteria bacterium RIFCSPHIGHO2_12_FULL_35_23]
MLIYFVSLFVFNIIFAQPLILILDWFINPDHAPIFVAEEQGYFKQAGLDVKIISPADPADPMKLVAAGQADIGISYQPQFMVAVSQGLPLVRIGTLINSPLACLAVLQTSNIKTIKDLRGKRIGYSTGGIDDITLQTMLKYNGLHLSDVQLVSFHYGQTQALLSGSVDAITGQMRNFEIPEMALAGHPARTFYPEDNGVPPYDELIFITNKKEINDPRLKKFMLAIQQGAQCLKQHPQQAWDIFAKNNPALNNSLNKISWFMTIQYFSLNPGKLDKQRYQAFAQFLLRAGLVTNLPPLNSYAIAES